MEVLKIKLFWETINKHNLTLTCMLLCRLLCNIHVYSAYKYYRQNINTKVNVLVYG